jgi:hypothetical protein
VILRNEKYIGDWVWNKRRFIKDPDTGRRRALPRPPEEWFRKEHPELRIVDAALWVAVRERLAFVEKTYGVGPGHPPRAGRTSPTRAICSPACSDADGVGPAW